MKPYATLIFSISLLFVCSSNSIAQSFENAGEYMDHIYKANSALSQKYLTYLSAVSHGRSARKVEKRRQEVVTAISDTRYSVMGMPPYKGDRSLKDTTVAYLKMLNYIFNEQYGKIVNMEEIAEQSYDAMEAYILAQEKAQEKLEEASEKQHDVQKKFAAKNNVNLLQSESELDSKMKIANQVMKHSHEVYLVFFKCYKQDAYVVEALDRKNLVSIEQNINSMKKFADDGLEKLKTMKGYNNDPSIIAACTDMMNFYKSEAVQYSALTDYFLKEENFNKLKKQFEAKSGSQRKKEDIDQYNKAVNDINAAMKEYNKTNSEMNKARASALNGWEKANKNYMDEHMPVQK